MNQVIAQKEEEKRNRIKAFVITLVINGLLFFLFFTIKFWSVEELKMQFPDV